MRGRPGRPRRETSPRRRPLVEAMEPRTLMATLTVTNTADSGTGSLRQAILDADAQPSADAIVFNIPGGGVRAIRPGSALPPLTATASVDGTTQPGYAGSPLIALDGTGAGGSAIGIEVKAAGCAITGLDVEDFPGRGISLEADGETVRACYVGIAPDGATAAPNGDDGVFVATSSNDRIGGPNPADGNLISGNKANGVHILFGGMAANTLLQNNKIGTNLAGTVAVKNNNSGINIFATAPNTQILGNLLSGNGGDGITYFGSDAADNLIQGNTIGTDVGGTLAIPNGGRGINLGGPPRARILGNLISGNLDAGINLGFDTAKGEVVQGNKIGTDINGILPLGNGGGGIVINFSSSNSTIGGPSPGQGNVIAYNTATFTDGGVVVDDSSVGIDISGNSIHDNKGLGIDLNQDGPTPNTPGGPHTKGGNLAQNYPVLTTASASASSTVVAGSINAAPGTTYRLEFFSSANPDPTGYGQGQTYLGFLAATTDSAGNSSFTANLPVGAAAGTVISATATDPAGNTSEFSKDIVVGGGGTGGGGGVGSADLTLTLAGSANPVAAGADLIYTAQVANNGPDAEGDVILADTLPAGVVFVSAFDNHGKPLTPLDGVITADLGPLPSGGSTGIQILVRPSASGVVADRATVSGDRNDPNPADNAATVSTTVSGSADVSVSVAATPDPVNLGADLTYTVTVSNAGPSAASGVSVADTLPTGAVFLSASASQGTPVRTGGILTTPSARWPPGRRRPSRSACIRSPWARSSTRPPPPRPPPTPTRGTTRRRSPPTWSAPRPSASRPRRTRPARGTARPPSPWSAAARPPRP